MDAYLDCSTTGISGDKFLAAALDAGASADAVRSALSSLDLGLELSLQDGMSGGIRALRVEVIGEQDPPERTWSSIRDLIAGSALDPSTRDASLAVFERLATAEAEVHRIEPGDVHFHEVGAADAIGEIVGVCEALHSLGIDRLWVSPVAVGSGSVECEHGTLPVPAPATASMLTGVPIWAGLCGGELTTPTGAALVSAMAHSFGEMPQMVAETIGHGAGTRELPTPNIARIFVGTVRGGSPEGAGRSGADPALTSEQVTMLSTTVDHIPGEVAGHALERILEAGALDAWITPCLMKKGRPGMIFEAIGRPDTARSIASAIIRETGSLGVRISPIDRSTVPRRTVEVATEWGPIRVKVADLPDGKRFRAEMDECAAIARLHGLAIDEVARTAEETAREDV